MASVFLLILYSFFGAVDDSLCLDTLVHIFQGKITLLLDGLMSYIDHLNILFKCLFRLLGYGFNNTGNLLCGYDNLLVFALNTWKNHRFFLRTINIILYSDGLRLSCRTILKLNFEFFNLLKWSDGRPRDDDTSIDVFLHFWRFFINLYF